MIVSLDAQALAPILADLGLDPDSAGDVLIGLEAGVPGPGVRETLAELCGSRLAPEGTLGVFLPEPRTDPELAAWRNELWPTAHLVALYHVEPGSVTRETLQGRETIDASPGMHGTLLVARRRELVLSPEKTVVKFDANAAGWNGAPGSAGYPHFRWMRRFVADFAGRVRPERILDFGCGAGWVGIEAALRAPVASLSSFDPSPEMVRITEDNARAAGIERFTGRTGFGEAPPFPAAGEAPFDLVLSSGVISFSPDTERWVDGLTRAVAPGGTLVIGDLNPASRGMHARRRAKPLLPVREMNARTADEVRRELESRGFQHRASANYQLTSPIPQAMHFNERRLKGMLSHPLLWMNRSTTWLARRVSLPAASWFDSWVMRFERGPGSS